MKCSAPDNLWHQALEVIRHSPSEGSSIEFASLAYQVLILLEYELSHANLLVAYQAALEGEELHWLIDRLEHESSSMCS
jgi:hypothetical protein